MENRNQYRQKNAIQINQGNHASSYIHASVNVGDAKIKLLLTFIFVSCVLHHPSTFHVPCSLSRHSQLTTMRARHDAELADTRSEGLAVAERRTP